MAILLEGEVDRLFAPAWRRAAGFGRWHRGDDEDEEEQRSGAHIA
jgi:hypothetical protein